TATATASARWKPIGSECGPPIDWGGTTSTISPEPIRATGRTALPKTLSQLSLQRHLRRASSIHLPTWTLRNFHSPKGSLETGSNGGTLQCLLGGRAKTNLLLR